MLRSLPSRSLWSILPLSKASFLTREGTAKHFPCIDGPNTNPRCPHRPRPCDFSHAWPPLSEGQRQSLCGFSHCSLWQSENMATDPRSYHSSWRRKDWNPGWLRMKSPSTMVIYTRYINVYIKLFNIQSRANSSNHTGVDLMEGLSGSDSQAEELLKTCIWMVRLSGKGFKNTLKKKRTN